MAYTYLYSDWSGGWKPSGSSVTKKYRAKLGYEIVTGVYDYAYIDAVLYVNINSSVNATYTGYLGYSSSQTTDYDTDTCKTVFGKDNTVLCMGFTAPIKKRTREQTLTLTGKIKSKAGSWTNKWVSISVDVTIPPLQSYQVDFNAGGGTGVMDSKLKYYGNPLYLPQNTFENEGFEFLEWKDSSNNTYYEGQAYTLNQAETFTAQWQGLHQPTCEYSAITDSSSQTNYTKTFSNLSITVSNVELYEDRTLDSIVLKVGSDTVTLNQPPSADTYTLTGLYPSASGEQEAFLILTDKDGDNNNVKKTYSLGTINIAEPTWEITKTFSSSTYGIPDTDEFGNSIITVEAEKYASGSWTGTYETIYGAYKAIDNGDNTWSITVAVDSNNVDSPTSTTPNTSIRLSFNHSVITEKTSISAFYKTTRNANFSNGIYNTMFISGCEATDFSSRVWWSQANNPLYFPDTNYVEVGSNDTSVMGLMKVGDYLGAIKQSKTTDTAIYLLYPTSFEEDTTYAVKQGVQGVGAIGKYTFNILGDETLFLSPKGVMAIAPYQDDEHKVLNRSYFVDGQLLKEENIKDAYSFVFEGKYYLAIDDNIYVLDGNQRNSWGNDKTNLVYECYYLTNVPADCFVKYNDSLMFSNGYGLCRFRKPDEINAYVDRYNGDDENVPVKARWSTVFDDDGSLNYYKTMQKKGNLVSVLPNSPFRYASVVITEEEFNADKTKYFTLSETQGYVRCTKDDVYDALVTYYVRLKTATKVFVRKDLNEPIEIQRQFGDSTEIPSELFINKKFKKYKRLQFIIENDQNEPFGVDTIVKQYTVGNYAKK